MAMWDIKKELGKDSELFNRVEKNYNDVHETYGIMEEFMDKASMNESKKMRESNEFKPGDIVDWFVPDDDEQYGKEFGGEVFHGGEVYKKQGDVYEVSFGEEGLFYPQGKDLEYHSENLLESKEEVEVEFKKTPDDGTVIAFFP